MGISTIISTDFVRGVVRSRDPAPRRVWMTDASRTGHRFRSCAARLRKAPARCSLRRRTRLETSSRTRASQTRSPTWSNASEPARHLHARTRYQAALTLPPAVKGYKAQSELVMTHLTQLLAGCEARGESAVVEGVHLNLSLVLPLMARHPTLFPFLITIRCDSLPCASLLARR